MKYRFLMLVICIPVSLLSDEPVTIRFDELASIITNSADVRLSEHDLKIRQQEIQQELKWSNPELEIEREQLSEQGIEDKEMVVGLGKEIMLPWAGSRHRDVQKDQQKLALTRFELDRLSILYEAKVRYMAVRLIEAKWQRYEKARGHIERVAQIAADRLDQGSISGLEHRMLELELANLDSRFVELVMSSDHHQALLKVLLGIESEQDLDLVTSLSDKDVVLQPDDSYERGLRRHPNIVQLEQQLDLHRDQWRMAKAQALPSVRMFGGYKQANESKGFVAGLSLPLPLFDRNQNNVRKHSLQIERHVLDMDQETRRLQSRIRLLYQACERDLDYFQAHAKAFQESESILDDLVFSFEKGWVSFADLFAGIQIYMEGLETLYARLQSLLESAILLESLTLQQTLDIDE